ncbi:MAG: hypothetical protein COT71_01740 [Candidatus Andersenbacteria bacterium CG10_big_fil_rev_8_21_14_0_10_54_11]|uniref:Glycosyltransferase 2-like domain-containing protein n=1 Tax=Candidatus Andersenbacteria bacterium CG10_big_fil_rev_8_21_14_0_10_54_11 TaxID=1974485 RepID=A0A2M6WZN4_9BACT|nr:MAG: hypothetical protein COT71_01740 [Candidatus Andersenbacteria bacterium CG10_big_fil_rev_8_21_14_0_10_54_11]
MKNTLSFKPKVSILLPVYNGESTFDAALASIAAQTYQNFEVICIDDGSTDTTPALLQRWQQQLPIKILTHSHNWGLTRSLNQAIAAARGELIARIDADDIWLPDKLQRQVDLLDNDPALGIVGCWYKNQTDEGVIAFALPETDQEIKRRIFRQNPLGHSCIVMRTVLVKQHGGYDESVRYGQDHELWLRLLPHTEFYNIPAYLCLRRVGGLSDRRVRAQMLQGIRTRLHYLHRYHAPLREYPFLLEPMLVAAAPAPVRRHWRRRQTMRGIPSGQRGTREMVSITANSKKNSTHRLQIACINDRFLPSIRAEQVARLRMAAGFVASGAAVDFWYHSRPRRPRPLPVGPDMNIHPISAPYLPGTSTLIRTVNRLLFVTSSLRLATKVPQRYDLFYLRCGALHGLLFAARSYWDTTPLVLEIHNLAFGSSPCIDRLYRFIFSRCRQVVCITAATRNNWQANGVPPQKIILLPSAPALDSCSLRPDRARRRLSLPDGPLAVYSGTLHSDRNIAEIIAAAARNRQINIVLVGGRADDEAQWQRHIRQRYGALPNIRFIGYQPAALIPLYLQAADAVLVTYSHSCTTAATMSPMKFAEALAAGKPIVAADLPRIREMAGNNHPITWYEPDNSRSLSSAISAAVRSRTNQHVPATLLTWQRRAHTLIVSSV